MTTTDVPLNSWSGQPLGTHSLVLVPDHGSRTPETSGWLAGSVGTGFYRLQRDQMPAFVAAHAHCMLVCADAAKVFWDLRAQFRAELPPAVGQLRRAVDEGRFVDLTVWLRLFELADGGEEVHVDGDPGPQLPDIAALCRCAAELEQRTCVQLGTRIGEPPFSRPNWLAMKYAMKGAIALRQPSPMQFELSTESRSSAIDELENRRSELERQIRQRPELLNCYQLAEGAIKQRLGLPNYKSHRLRTRLQQRWNALRDEHEFPAPAPRRRGAISPYPEDWGCLACCDEEIAIWSAYEQCCRTAEFLRKLDVGVVDVRHEILPRTWLHASAVCHLLGSGWLRPRPDKALLLVWFPDLESRCLAATCRARFGTSTLAQAALENLSLNRYVAEFLSLSMLVPQPARARAVLDRELETVAAKVLFGTALKLSDRALRNFVSHESHINFDHQQIRTVREHLVQGFAELDALECETPNLIARNLNIQPGPWPQGERAATFEFHRTIDAESWDSFRWLLDPCTPGYHTTERLNEQRKRQSFSEFADEMLSERRQTFTGRVRAQCPLTRLTAEFLDVADDVLKAVGFEIAVEQGRPVAIIGNTLVAEIGEQEDQVRIQGQMEAVAGAVGQQVLQMPSPCESRVAVCW